MTKIFIFETVEKRDEWYHDKQIIKKEMDGIGATIDHEKKGIHMSREEMEHRTDTWLANVAAFKEKWGDHMVPGDI